MYVTNWSEKEYGSVGGKQANGLVDARKKCEKTSVLETLTVVAPDTRVGICEYCWREVCMIAGSQVCRCFCFFYEVGEVNILWIPMFILGWKSGFRISIAVRTDIQIEYVCLLGGKLWRAGMTCYCSA